MLITYQWLWGCWFGARGHVVDKIPKSKTTRDSCVLNIRSSLPAAASSCNKPEISQSAPPTHTQYLAPAASYELCTLTILCVYILYTCVCILYSPYICMYVYRRVGYLACASRPFRFYRVFAYLVYGWLVCSSLVDLFFFSLFLFRFFALLKHRVVQIINILNLWWAEPETRVFSESSNDNDSDSDNATIMYGTVCVFLSNSM